MEAALQIYILLILAGLFLIGVEIFVPGGIVGTLGALALVGAMLMGFKAFGLGGGMLSAFAIILLAGIGLILWVRYFPRTSMGRHLTLSKNARDFKAPPAEWKKLVGKEGVTHSPLRPGGIALIEGRRVDVIAEGSWIENGRPIRVISVEGSRVVVREIPTTSGTA